MDMEAVVVRLAELVPGIEDAHQGEAAFCNSDPPPRSVTYIESFISFVRSRLELRDHDAIARACAVMEQMAAAGDAGVRSALREEVLAPLAGAPEAQGAQFRDAMGPALRREWEALLGAADLLDYALRLLSPAGRAAADFLIDSNVAAVRDGLAALEIAEPACALCLTHPHVEELAAEGPEGTCTITTISVEIQAFRQQKTEEDPEEWLLGAWLGAEFVTDLLPLQRTDHSAMRDAERALDAAADELPHPDAGGHRARYLWTQWPVEWLFTEVCRRLYREPSEDLRRTADFVVFHQGWNFDPYPIDLLPDVAPDHVIGLLQEKGLFQPWSESREDADA